MFHNKAPKQLKLTIKYEEIALLIPTNTSKDTYH